MNVRTQEPNPAMNRYQPLIPIALAALLGACANAPATVPEPPPASAPDAPAPAAVDAAPSRQPGLRGQLLGVAAGAEVELALLAVDARGRPGRLLGQLRLRGDGNPLPFDLPLASGADGQRLELRGRVSLSGRLVQRLPPRAIGELADQDLGSLYLVPAP